MRIIFGLAAVVLPVGAQLAQKRCVLPARGFDLGLKLSPLAQLHLDQRLALALIALQGRMGLGDVLTLDGARGCL